MRVIKFRAWDKIIGCWSDDPSNSLAEISIKLNGHVSILDDCGTYRPNDYIIEQFTGIRDKNGKEIYEGDICRIVRYNGELQTAGDIFFDKGAFRITNGYAVADTDSLGRFKADIVEVVGNIHENPDLLN